MSISQAGQPRRRSLLLGLAVAPLSLTGAAALPSAASAGTSGSREPKPTVVLVHGAFADASGFNDVVRLLLLRGYPVLAPANPLRAVAHDSAYIASVLRTITGPIVLVGHSYGGFVNTNAAKGNPNVKALVYIAAFAPDTGDTVGGLAGMFPGSQLGPEALDFRPYPLEEHLDGYDGYIKLSLFRQVFAADVPAATAAVMAATQRPADAGTLQQHSGPPAWRDIPSWTLVASADKVIPAAAQRFMANRAGSKVVEVSASHVAMVSKPLVTAELIMAAARATT